MKSELEADYKKDRASGSWTFDGYSVEARHNYHDPMTVSGQVFDRTWRRVNFDESVIGVPLPRFRRHALAEHGYLGYASAQALRWWFHAAIEAEQGLGICMETRLVKHSIHTTHKITAVSAHCHIHGEDRSNTMPDWGQKHEA